MTKLRVEVTVDGHKQKVTEYKSTPQYRCSNTSAFDLASLLYSNVVCESAYGVDIEVRVKRYVSDVYSIKSEDRLVEIMTISGKKQIDGLVQARHEVLTRDSDADCTCVCLILYETRITMDKGTPTAPWIPINVWVDEWQGEDE